MEPKIEVVQIDPDRALQLLEHNEHNRPMDWSLVALYQRQMEQPDGWRFVGDPIRVSVTGRLLDGQNRLQAVVLSKTTQTFVLVTNLPDESQPYMDVGKKRSASDVFSMYEVPNAPKAAAVTNLLVRYDLRNMLDTKFRLPHAELLAYYQRPENTELIDRATVVGQAMIKLVPISPAVVGAMHAIVSRDSDAFVINEFFEKLRLGYGLEEGDAISALRNWVIRRKREDLRVNRNEYFYLLVRTWNDWVQHIPVYRVQLPKGGLQASDQIPRAKVAHEQDGEPVSEDNPVTTPYSKTRKEREAEKKAS
jgi:hypothetical protein